MLRPRQVDPDRAANVEIVLTEACSNAVRHAASGGTYEVGVRVDHSRCAVEVADQGDGVDIPPVIAQPAPKLNRAAGCG